MLVTVDTINFVPPEIKEGIPEQILVKILELANAEAVGHEDVRGVYVSDYSRSDSEGVRKHLGYNVGVNYTKPGRQRVDSVEGWVAS